MSKHAHDPVPPTPPKTTPAAVPSTAPVSADTVSIKSTGFEPGAVSVKVGTTVHFRNDDASVRTVTFDEALNQGSGDISPGVVWDRLFDQPGSYGYHCDKNPNHKGTVVVS